MVIEINTSLKYLHTFLSHSSHYKWNVLVSNLHFCKACKYVSITVISRIREGYTFDEFTLGKLFRKNAVQKLQKFGRVWICCKVIVSWYAGTSINFLFYRHKDKIQHRVKNKTEVDVERVGAVLKGYTCILSTGKV